MAIIKVYEDGNHWIVIEKYDNGITSIDDNLHINYDATTHLSMFDDPDTWNNMLDSLTCMILHCYNNGVDVTNDKFKQSIADTLETIGNYI